MPNEKISTSEAIQELRTRAIREYNRLSQELSEKRIAMTAGRIEEMREKIGIQRGLIEAYSTSWDFIAKEISARVDRDIACDFARLNAMMSGKSVQDAFFENPKV